MKKQIQMVLGLFALVSCASALFAQSAGSGTITGTVKDPAGAFVVSAGVLVHNPETGIDRAVETNADGLYSATFLQPGPYEVTVSKAGFAKLVRTGLTLQVGQTLTVDVQLQIQTTSDTVTVSGEAAIVDPSKTDVSQVVSTGFVNNLPIAGRRWESFVLLTPNVTTDGGSGLISYRGISGLYNSTAVDGANNSQALFSETRGRATGIPYVYSQDSIQEFQVSSANYSAEMGQAAGGITNAVTKSGTNAIHGDLFYYLRYPSWNALDPMAKSQGIYTQPIHQQQQFGGSVGGAIIKDKLFYFFTYDGSRKVNPILYTSTVKYPLACPAQVNAAACAAANAFLAAQAGAFPRFFNQDIGFGKLDYQLNAKNHIASSFNLVDFKAPNSYQGSTSLFEQLGDGTTARTSPMSGSSSPTGIRPSPTTMVNNVRFQWGQDLEITGANFSGPSVNIGSGSVDTYGMPNALPRAAEPNEHRIQFADVLSMDTRHPHNQGGFRHQPDPRSHDQPVPRRRRLHLPGAAQTAFKNWVADVAGTNLGDGLTGRHWTTFHRRPTRSRTSGRTISG